MNSLYLQKIKTSCPELDIQNIRENRDGLINDVFIINEDRVFRFAKDIKGTKKALKNEIQFVKLIEPYVGLNVPEFDLIEDDFVSYPYIPGKPLLRNDIVILIDSEQDKLAQQLAQFLKEMHTLPEGVWTEHEIGPSDVNRNRDVWCKLYEDIQEQLFPHMMSHAIELVRRHFEPVISDRLSMEYQPALINGDMGAYHILYDSAQKMINGVIDFGTAGVGDPAADLACMLYYYGENFVQRMNKFYPELNEAIDRARFWAGTFELQCALGGIRTKNLSWFMTHLGGMKDMNPLTVKAE